MHKSIQDFFKINLDQVPNNTFSGGNEIINASGQALKSFRKLLENIECNIFNTIEVIQFEDGMKNIFFINHQLDTVSIDKVRKLIDDLYFVFGQDDDHKGMYNIKDKEDFYSDDFCALFGRNWNAIKTPIALGIDRETNNISLRIWGIN